MISFAGGKKILQDQFLYFSLLDNLVLMSLQQRLWYFRYLIHIKFKVKGLLILLARSLHCSIGSSLTVCTWLSCPRDPALYVSQITLHQCPITFSSWTLDGSVALLTQLLSAVTFCGLFMATCYGKKKSTQNITTPSNITIHTGPTAFVYRILSFAHLQSSIRCWETQTPIKFQHPPPSRAPKVLLLVNISVPHTRQPHP